LASGPAGAQRIGQRHRFDQRRTAGVDQQRRQLHAREIRSVSK